MDNKKDILWRVYVLYGFIVLFGLAVLFQVFKVQFIQGDELRAKAQALTTKYHSIDAARGNIYACDGSLLATSLPIYEIRMDVAAEGITDSYFASNVDSLAIELAGLFKDKSAKQYASDLKRARRNQQRYFLIRRNVRYTELKQLKKFHIFKNGRYKGGMIYLQENKREMPFKNLAVRTIGYKRDNLKPVGLEGAYNEYLKGIGGKRLMQRISGNDWMPINDENEIEPVNGADIITTIDANIQDVAQDALRKQLIKSKAHHGCAIMMEVSTGAIKAIANLTRIDSVTYIEDYNYALGEATYPGSTFKLASYMAAIDDGKCDINDSINIEGGKKQFLDRIVKDSHPKDNVLSIKKAFEVSSNVAIAKLIYQAYGKNATAFTDKLLSFGLGANLNVELPGEGKARIKLPKDKDWYSTTLPYLAHGYECLLTPLQMLTFYNAVANNGTVVKPMFVSKIIRKGVTEKEFSPVTIKKNICKESTLAQVKKMLEGVVENGTAKNLKNNYLKIAGKTGTAVLEGFAKNSNDNDNTNKKYQASYIGYFPADNPKYSIAIVINNPSHDAFYGNVVAGPIFREIADKVYSTSIEMHKDLERDTTKGKLFNPQIKNGNSDDLDLLAGVYNIKSPGKQGGWVQARNEKDIIQYKQEYINNDKTPNVIGMNLQDALLILENNGYAVTVKGRGAVAKQSIPPGTAKPATNKILIELS